MARWRLNDKNRTRHVKSSKNIRDCSDEKVVGSSEVGQSLSYRQSHNQTSVGCRGRRQSRWISGVFFIRGSLVVRVLLKDFNLWYLFWIRKIVINANLKPSDKYKYNLNIIHFLIKIYHNLDDLQDIHLFAKQTKDPFQLYWVREYEALLHYMFQRGV